MLENTSAEIAVMPRSRRWIRLPTEPLARRVEQLRSIMPEPLAEIHPLVARRYKLASGDSVTLATRRGTATFTVKVTTDIREDTIFVPFHWSGNQSGNRLTNPALDPTSRMPEFKVCAVRIVPRVATREDEL